MHVIDLEGNEYPLQATTTNEGEVNGNQTLSAKIEYNKVNKQFIKNLDRLWRVVDHDAVEHVIKYYKRQGKGNKMTAEIKAIPLFFDVLDNDRIYERYDKHMMAEETFTLIFNGTGFTFVLVDSFYAVDWEGFGDGESKLESFKRALERYKCEFEIVGNVVYLRTQIGRDTDIQYRHRLNASNIVQEIDANEMWTYARGYGDYDDAESENGGWQNAKLKREYVSPLEKVIGRRRHAPPIKDGRITDKDTMDKSLKTLVDESLKISVSADIHDLRKQNYPIAQSELGDRVFLIDERIGLNDEVRVVSQSITRDWKGNVIDLNITFGSHGIAKRHQSNLQTAVKNITNLLEGKIQLQYNVLPNAVRVASEALRSAMTELEFNNGIIARDPNDPNRLVLFNSAGLGISLDGGISFEEAITYLGINTKLLTAGDIHTNHIRIVGKDNFFFWDGNSLQAINPNDIRKYVKLDSSGLYIARGALTIERPDGALFVQNGIPKFNYNVQMENYFDDGVSWNGKWYETQQRGSRSYKIASFRHEGRYLKMNTLVRLSGFSPSNSEYMYYGVRPLNGNVIRVNHIERALVFNAESQSLILTIDMGVPTYQEVSIYLVFYKERLDNGGTHDDNIIQVRTNRAWQEG